MPVFTSQMCLQIGSTASAYQGLLPMLTAKRVLRPSAVMPVCASQPCPETARMQAASLSSSMPAKTTLVCEQVFRQINKASGA